MLLPALATTVHFTRLASKTASQSTCSCRLADKQPPKCILPDWQVRQPATHITADWQITQPPECFLLALASTMHFTRMASETPSRSTCNSCNCKLASNSAFYNTGKWDRQYNLVDVYVKLYVETSAMCHFKILKLDHIDLVPFSCKDINVIMCSKADAF